MTTIEYASARFGGLARQLRLLPLLLTLLALPFVLAGRTGFAAQSAFRWSVAAVRLGYVEARDRAG